MAEDLRELARLLRDFADERDWQQFHSPKNLVIALAAEVGELLEPFQWLTSDESWAVLEGSRRDDVRDELADVMIYLVRLADVLGVDLIETAAAKLERNQKRFPTDRHRGRADVAPTE